jgi:hypothetical protein
MAAFEPLIAFLAILVPLALAGMLVEWMARRRRWSHPKAEPTAGAQRKTES